MAPVSVHILSCELKFCIITDVMLASAPVVMLSLISFHLHVSLAAGMCALDAGLFNFMHSSCLIGLPCVRACVCSCACVRYCQQQSLSASVKAKSICWFLDVVKKPEVIMQNGRLKSRENPGELRGEEEDWERGKRDYTLEIRAKAARPPPGLFFTPFTTKERIFITL